MKSTTFLSRYFNRHIDPTSNEYMHGSDWRYIPARVVRIVHIDVQQDETVDVLAENPLKKGHYQWKPF